MHRTSLASLAVLVAIAPELSAQDPAPPAGGFAIVKRLDIKIPLTGNSGTLMNAIYPNVKAPRTGWSVVVLIHGGGGNRNSPYIVPLQEKLAAAGTSSDYASTSRP